MHFKTVILSVLALSLSAAGAFGQSNGTAAQTHDSYSRYHRFTDHPGTLTFFVKSDGKTYIKAEDNYGARIIGLKDGYTQNDLDNLVKYLKNNNSIMCMLINPVYVGTSYSALVDSLSMLRYLPVAPIMISLIYGCNEEAQLDKQAVANTKEVLGDLKYSDFYKLEPAENSGGYKLVPREKMVSIPLDAKNYWHLYDLIENESGLEGSAAGFNRLNGNSTSTR